MEYAPICCFNLDRHIWIQRQPRIVLPAQDSRNHLIVVGVHCPVNRRARDGHCPALAVLIDKGDVAGEFGHAVSLARILESARLACPEGVPGTLCSTKRGRP